MSHFSNFCGLRDSRKQLNKHLFGMPNFEFYTFFTNAAPSTQTHSSKHLSCAFVKLNRSFFTPFVIIWFLRAVSKSISTFEEAETCMAQLQQQGGRRTRPHRRMIRPPLLQDPRATQPIHAVPAHPAFSASTEERRSVSICLTMAEAGKNGQRRAAGYLREWTGGRSGGWSGGWSGGRSPTQSLRRSALAAVGDAATVIRAENLLLVGSCGRRSRSRVVWRLLIIYSILQNTNNRLCHVCSYFR